MSIRPIKTLEIAAQSGDAIQVTKGEIIKLIDVQGAQVADLFACVSGNPTEWLSTGHTRTKTQRLFPIVGQAFCTQSYRSVLRFLDDASPGTHDMFYPSCDPVMYRRLGGAPDHPNCFDNFWKAAGAFDWKPPVIPDPVNFFQNTPSNDEGGLEVKSALTAASDFVILQAEVDLLLIVTACSQDLAPINGDQCTDLLLEIYNENARTALLGKTE